VSANEARAQARYGKGRTRNENKTERKKKEETKTKKKQKKRKEEKEKNEKRKKKREKKIESPRIFMQWKNKRGTRQRARACFKKSSTNNSYFGNGFHRWFPRALRLAVAWFPPPFFPIFFPLLFSLFSPNTQPCARYARGPIRVIIILPIRKQIHISAFISGIGGNSREDRFPRYSRRETRHAGTPREEFPSGIALTGRVAGGFLGDLSRTFTIKGVRARPFSPAMAVHLSAMRFTGHSSVCRWRFIRTSHRDVYKTGNTDSARIYGQAYTPRCSVASLGAAERKCPPDSVHVR